jgi:hypothetical protein
MDGHGRGQRDHDRARMLFFLCMRKYEYLLRDVKFTLKTDHANILYLNVPPSNKVLRWKLAIQE